MTRIINRYKWHADVSHLISQYIHLKQVKNLSRLNNVLFRATSINLFNTVGILLQMRTLR